MHVEKLELVDPLKLYFVIREFDNPFMLESRTKHEKKARYTYISFSPEFTIEVDEKGTKINGKRKSKERNVFRALKEIQDFEEYRSGERFYGGFVGYISYDTVHNYIGGEILEPSFFGFYRHFFVYDHLNNELLFISPEKNLEANKIVSKAKKVKILKREISSEILGCDADKEKFMEMVERGKEHIYAGDVFQIVLSREYEIETDASPFEIYSKLREVNPSPYMFLLEFGKKIIGASPETLASVEKNIMKVNPIAGTAPRGKNEEEDRKITEKMLSDEKEKAEHIMLVDLARNDVRKVCKSRSVIVRTFMDVVKYSHVQHIESEVIGELREGATMFEAIEAAFPAGTLTGAPKIRAMELIDVIEKSRRRVYGGCVGYFSMSGYADMAIAIRMMEIDDVCRVRAGAGIVVDSKPEREFYETERKMNAVLKVLEVEKDDFDSG